MRSHVLILLIIKVFYQLGTAIINEERIYDCMCVPFWECSEDYTELISDGSFLMDIRNREARGYCQGDFDVCCRVPCGFPVGGDFHSTEENAPRILGHNAEVKFSDYPWMLAVMEKGKYICGASLIHSKVALTAAHCVQNEAVYQVRAGEWNWNNSLEPLPHQDRTVETIIIHPEFQTQWLQNDIALLIMDTQFYLNKNVGIICLPQRDFYPRYKKCTATGWGKTSSRSSHYESVLKAVAMPLVSNYICAKNFRNYLSRPHFQLHDSVICAGGINKDTCKGDGGSPLVCPLSKDGDRFEQIGIVSWGTPCGVFDYPGVYVNVGRFVEWIDSVMDIYNFDSSVYKY